jgi:hypothetical protein
MQPSIGRSGTLYPARCGLLASDVATPLARSRRHRTLLPASFIVTASPASSPRGTMPSSLIAQSRLSRSLAMCTTSVSPGSAPSM